MTAHQLQKRCTAPFTLTIYEAGSRLGGKILTKEFSHAPVVYEAGTAELYDYTCVGEDPLRDLIAELGLTTKPMGGAAVVMDDKVIYDIDDTRLKLGETTWEALKQFDDYAKRWMSPLEFYEADWKEGTVDPMATETFQTLLSEIPDAAARRYLRTLVHSDLATEPHQTSAYYGLQNYLMNDPAYMSLYTIDGGIERFIKSLASRVTARILYNEPVDFVELASDYNEDIAVTSRRDGKFVTENYDFVVAALPYNWLATIDWGGDNLADAMLKHRLHYERPAHYLRVSVLFRKQFWGEELRGSYLMLDSFGGCCLYDESSRNNHGQYGVLGWLLGGDFASAMGNLTDEELIARVLDSLPSFLRHGKDLVIEGRVHRWVGAVNGAPGGAFPENVEARHTPEPVDHSNLLVVGDYLFDSTLNGVLDSADLVAEIIAEDMLLPEYQNPVQDPTQAPAPDPLPLDEQLSTVTPR